MCSRFQVMKVVLRLVKSFSGPPEPVTNATAVATFLTRFTVDCALSEPRPLGSGRCSQVTVHPHGPPSQHPAAFMAVNTSLQLQPDRFLTGAALIRWRETRPSFSMTPTRCRSNSDCSMRHPPRRLCNHPGLLPVRMFRPQVAHEHPPRRRVHPKGDPQPFGPALRPKNRGHLLVHHLDLSRVQTHRATTGVP